MRCFMLLFFLGGWISSVAQTPNLIYINDGNNDIYTVNPENCSKTLVGNTGTGSTTFLDIAIDPTTGIMYGISNGMGDLYTINTSNASANFIGTTGLENATSLTCDANGTLYAAIGATGITNDLYTINKATGSATSLGNLGAGIFSAGDLTFINGSLYLAGADSTLIQIDIDNPSNSEVIGLFENQVRMFGILTHNVNCAYEVYAFAGNDMYSLNQQNLISNELLCENLTNSSIFGAASISEDTPPCFDSLSLPNIFTPNNDNFNEVFRLQELTGIDEFELKIYNRWGKLIYETLDKNFQWSGVNQEDQQMQDGVFYWTASFSTLQGDQKSDKGTVTLIR